MKSKSNIVTFLLCDSKKEKATKGGKQMNATIVECYGEGINEDGEYKDVVHAPREKYIYWEKIRPGKDMDIKTLGKMCAPIRFYNGSLVVNKKREPRLFEYLTSLEIFKGHPHRDKNRTPIFELFDPFAGRAEKSAKIILASKYINDIQEKELDEIMSICALININTKDMDGTDEEIRQYLIYEISEYISANVEDYEKKITSPTAIAKSKLLQAFKAGVITMNNTSLMWKKNKAPRKKTIISSPVGHNPLDYFVNKLDITEYSDLYTAIVLEMEELDEKK